ncbi:DNA polymerase III, clamp loader complex, gamma/delta/delta subunit [Cantharellus anzutake]|uniref:DNA polymerase III, clamp loader complex, gamma/delta/delta subunit n=1 Tax=Cantharellus anzutake TaxID=1750568 RepID=UPI001906133E|nr:DNA polymerase III, clamp loader complex, gamma/delta/delta subunit [Cantharellus anzutake]KAF8342030.1 DNA polymerase III, clamp loader complex, gamma/delta/delta subunit [Cantharellus anzutake]
MRPQSLDDFFGHQEHVGPGTLLRGLIDSGTCGSLLLWGPPGSGKTTLARIIARSTHSIIKELSATSAGTADVRAVFEEAKNVLSLSGKRTVMFVDEIQRFNKAQQDLFLPYVEKGWVQLIAATTENPSFKVVAALLSRCRVIVLWRIFDTDMMKILLNAINRMRDSIKQEHATLATNTKVLECIVGLSIGDARTALNLLELVLQAPSNVSVEQILNSLKTTTLSRYDRTGDDRYEMISALHKSIRGSDGSAALYWLARMLTAGEDPLYVARRLIVVASEDVGLADTHALPLATATYFACQNIGLPECRINLAHCVSYLAEAKKSIRAYEAYNRAEAEAKRTSALSVPIAVRNAPTQFMETLGYGAEYLYNPNFAHPVTNNYLPEEVKHTLQVDGPFLRTAEDYTKERTWSEERLKRWEEEVNRGEKWEGRPTNSSPQ